MGLFDFWKKEGKIDKKFKKLHNNLNNSFLNIKNDMENFSKWVMHLEKSRSYHHTKIDEIEKKITGLEMVLEELKYAQSFVQTPLVSKHKQTAVRLKQTAVGVQTPVWSVQTAVQTADKTFKLAEENEINDILKGLTVMERAVLWTILNTDLKMSYDDLSVLLGRDKSTLRGQINNIKRKSESLISENVEINGKKRFFIDENVKKMILSSMNIKRMGAQTRVLNKKGAKNES